jgi:hypothetical protein
MFDDRSVIVGTTNSTSQMPTLILTAEQAEQLRAIIELQKAREIGCLAVVNFGFDRTTGERTVELSFACLEWSNAVSICGKIKKLTTVPLNAE